MKSALDASRGNSTRPAPVQGAAAGERATPTLRPGAGGPAAGDADRDIELTVEVQEQVQSLYEQLPHADHFSLLGVPSTCDRKTVRNAYYARIAAFHPDSYFGKNLGEFRRKMEAVFQRLTEAYETLSHKQSRAEYETYLAARQATTRAERGFSEREFLEMEQLFERAVRESGRPPPSAAAVGGRQADSTSALRATPRSQTSPPARPPRGAPSTQLLQPADAEARRRSLARKLGLPPRPPSGNHAPAIAPASAERPSADGKAAAAERFKAIYSERRHAVESRRITEYLQAAESALSSGEAAGALNLLKLAKQLPGLDEDSNLRITALSSRAEMELSESYLKQARYEESNGQAAAAGRSYARAARGRPSASVFKSAAECFLKAGGDLKQAADAARKAVALAPDRVDLRLTLARVYEEAGMQQSALGELERASQLSPESERIKHWLKRLKVEGV